MKHLFKILCLPLFLALLTGCYQESPNEGRLSLGISDAPIDGVTSLVLTVHSIGLKPVSGDPILIHLPTPKSIDLITLQGDKFEELLYQEPVPAGRYSWIRLYIDPTDAYFQIDRKTKNLGVRTNEDGGVDVATSIEILPGGQVFAIIDLDLRTSLKPPSGDIPDHYIEADMRLIEIADAGHISGSVTSTALNHIDCATRNLAVYLYEGSGITPDDYDGVSPAQNEDDRGPDPFTSALVFLNPSASSGSYAFGFLPPGDYTMAYTCNADLDTVNREDRLVKFLGQLDITVFKGKTTLYDFTGQ